MTDMILASDTINNETQWVPSESEYNSIKDSTSYYMELLKGNHLFSEEEEKEYFLAYKANPTKELRNKIFESNMRLVVSIAKQYAKNINNMEFVDLISEGNLGLLKAIDLYDVDTGNRFSTYATWWIRQTITRAIADKETLIRIPVHQHERIGKINRYIAKYISENNRTPSTEEIMESLHLSKHEVEDTMSSFVYYNIDSLNREIGQSEHGDVTELGDFIEDTNFRLEAQFEQNELAEVMLNLLDDYIYYKKTTPGQKERIKQICMKRFGLGGYTSHTLESIGQEYGLTKERVRQIAEGFVRYLSRRHIKEKLRVFMK